jgi:hypothetical protein
LKNDHDLAVQDSVKRIAQVDSRVAASAVRPGDGNEIWNPPIRL